MVDLINLDDQGPISESIIPEKPPQEESSADIIPHKRNSNKPRQNSGFSRNNLDSSSRNSPNMESSENNTPERNSPISVPAQKRDSRFKGPLDVTDNLNSIRNDDSINNTINLNNSNSVNRGENIPINIPRVRRNTRTLIARQATNKDSP